MRFKLFESICGPQRDRKLSWTLELYFHQVPRQKAKLLLHAEHVGVTRKSVWLFHSFSAKGTMCGTQVSATQGFQSVSESRQAFIENHLDTDLRKSSLSQQRHLLG